jgi:very-short-patch-repair endonuclease
MPSLDGRVAMWMQSHRATVSSEFLDASGISRSKRKRLVEARVIERVVDGAYRFVGVEPDELTRCAALCTSRPNLVVAGPTAGRIWKIRRSPRDEHVHVIGPPRSQPCSHPWVKVYRTALIHPDEIVFRPDGIRITSPPRTLIDLSRYLDDEALASAIEFALSAGLCTLATLTRLARRLDTPGRSWVKRFLRILAARHPGRPRESDWERRVLDALVARGVADLESQVWQRVPGYGPARFDLAIPSIQWVLEVDVHPEHRSISGQGNDHRRDRSARRVGWATERVGEAELSTDFEWTMDDLVESIDARRREVAALQEANLWLPRSPR